MSGNNIVTVGAHQTSYGGGGDDSFIAKFDINGLRLWSTYYGGNQIEWGQSCAVANDGSAYLVGYTYSSDGIASGGSYQSTFGGGIDAFIAKFNSSGVRQWGTYFGSTGPEMAYSCSLDQVSGSLYICGHVSADGIASPGAYQTLLSGGSNTDAFLAKFSSSGFRQWCTLYGGTDLEYGLSCKYKSSSNIVYLVGTTRSNAAISTAGVHQTTYSGFFDAFLVGFNSSGSRQWATYYGGSSSTYGYGCSFSNDAIYVSGYTTMEHQ